jgi:hypothetical protein
MIQGDEGEKDSSNGDEIPAVAEGVQSPHRMDGCHRSCYSISSSSAISRAAIVIALEALWILPIANHDRPPSRTRFSEARGFS